MEGRETLNDLPQDIRLWLLTANGATGKLVQEVPLPMSHDALKRGLVRDDAGTWILTNNGRALHKKLLDD